MKPYVLLLMILMIILIATLAVQLYPLSDSNPKDPVKPSLFGPYQPDADAWQPMTGAQPNQYSSFRFQGNPITVPLNETISMVFVLIPAGKFLMGSLPDDPERYDRETAHQVTLTREFYLQTTEVTQGQWMAVMKRNPSFFKECGLDCPVEQVSWHDAQMFIRRLNLKYGRNRFMLPTEAQWEYACRAGTQTRFHWGDLADCSKANFGNGFRQNECKPENPGKPIKVKQYPPNRWGLFDMHGNVAEWCEDRFGQYPTGDITDPIGAYAGIKRVYRGGSWADGARYCRCANRDEAFPTQRFMHVGFRLAARKDM